MYYTQPGRTNFLLLCLAASLACLPRVTQCSGGLTPLHAQGSGSLAILDLEGRGISAIEAASLTDRLRTALVRTRAVTVVERGQMERVLSEQDFQLTGCTSDECAVEVGQLLGVTTMVAGSIGKVGSTFSIDIRTIDVQSGRITHSMWRDYRGEIDGLLGIMPEIAEELVSVAIVAETPPPEVAAPASIAITTQPPGARIVLDGQDAGTTPLEGAELEPDRSHAVSLSLDGYQPVDTSIFAEADQSYELNVPLKRLASQLSIHSTPPGAMVFLDSRRLRATPLSLPEVAPDRQHQVSLRLDGYQQADTTFFARAGEHHRMNIALQPVSVAATMVKPPEVPPPETQQPQPSVKPAKAGGGGVLVVLVLLAAGYYGYTQGWFGEKPSEEGLRVGKPPSVPSP